MINVLQILKILKKSTVLHPLCRSIFRNKDGIWFVCGGKKGGQVAISLPEFEMPKEINFEHRIYANAIYLGPGKGAYNPVWQSEENIQRLIDGSFNDPRGFHPDVYNLPILRGFDYDAELHQFRQGKLLWDFSEDPVMQYLIKHEPLHLNELSFFRQAQNWLSSAACYRIVNPNRSFYAIFTDD